MSLLEEFVFALSKTEREKLRPLQFRGVKRRIFLKILKCRHRSGIDASSIVRTNKLTRHRYNQMLSEMLAACYRDVAPRGGVDLLQFLGNKQLFRHHYLEMRRQESQLIAANRPKALEQYYLKVILASEFFMVPPGNAKLITEGRDYLRRYIAVKQDPHKYDQLLLRAEEIDEKIEHYVKTTFDEQQILLHFGELDDILNIAEGTHPLLEFLTCFKLIRHYLRLLSDSDRAEHYYAKAKSILATDSHLFKDTQDLFELQVEFEIANKTGRSVVLNFDEKKVWRNGFPLRFMYFFFPLLLKARDFQRAKFYITKYFPANPDLVSNDVAIFYWKLLMQNAIYTGDLQEGERCLHKALEANERKSRNVRMDILFRQYEPFFTAMKGDPVHAEEQIKRNNRYMTRHGYESSDFLKSFGALMKCIGDVVTARRIYDEYLSTLSKANHMSILFAKLFTKYFGKLTA